MKFMDTKSRASGATITGVVRRKKDGKSKVTSEDVNRAALVGNAGYQYYVITGHLPASK